MQKSPSIPKSLVIEGQTLDYNKFGEELSQAVYSLGLLEGSQKKLQNASLLISPLTAKEATVSSRIEGTQSTVSDIFLYEAGGSPQHSDVRQVVNYRLAMQFAIKEIKRGRPLDHHLVRSLHAMLLEGVRHKGHLGSYRTKQVWIAEKDGDPIEKAIYIPPEAHLVPGYMENLFNYVDQGRESTLIRAAIAHYQFEAVHPFEDGNGRIGRLLIPLILFHKQQLSQPILYLSGYFDEHRPEYISSLHQTDETGELETWLKFFFKSTAAQLETTQALVEKVYNLFTQVKDEHGVVKSPFFLPFLNYLFISPIFTTAKAQKNIKCSSRLTVSSMIEMFKRKGHVVELSAREGQYKLYSFKPLLDAIS